MSDRDDLDREDHPGCAHQVFQSTHGGESEPTNVCSCSAGLIHMHDCPVMNGMECRWFEASETAEKTLVYRDFVEVHGQLMDVFLSRIYHHRVRGLRPGTSAFAKRCEDLLERYAREVDPDVEDEPELTEEQVARYTEDKERLIAQRKRREEQRAEQEAKSREERAIDRAKMGIKTVVQKAQETVAARGGNVSESTVDDMPSAKPARKKRRSRRRSSSKSGDRSGNRAGTPASAPSGSPSGSPSGAPAGPSGTPSGGAEGGAPKKRRRRRRRSKPSGSGPAGSGPSGSGPAGSGSTGSGGSSSPPSGGDSA